MEKQSNFNDFLTEQGQAIFQAIKTHCSQIGLMDADEYEIAMLANSFDVYSQNATYCKENGQTYEMPTKTGTYPMIRPEYNVMKNAYVEIQKTAEKFGLNPAARAKIFNMKKGKDEKKKGFDLTGDKMKVA